MKILKKPYVFILSLVVAIFGNISTAWSYSGGTGTSADPYLISSAADLEELGSTTTDYSKYFKLTNHIDLTGRGYSQAVIAGDTDTDATYDGTRFSGVFDGNGYTISNLTINGVYYDALFGSIAAGGVVKNLGLPGVKIEATGNFVGAFCGFNYGTISNCYATGSVKAANYVGGLCGRNNSVISYCYSTAKVTGTSSYKGAIAGYLYGSLSACFWDKQVSGMTAGVGYGSVTGVTGLNTDQMLVKTNFTAAGWDFSAADGDAADWQMPAGWYPSLINEVVNMAQIPTLVGLTQTQAEAALVSAGMTLGTVSYVYDAGVAGQVYSQSPAVGTLWRAGFPLTVNITISMVAKYSGGSGTAADPYKIVSIDDLTELGETPADYGKYFKLMNNIDLGGVAYTKAVIAFDPDNNSSFDGMAFTGHFDGDGHVISNLTINGDYYCGLFGYVSAGAVITELGLVNVNISGKLYIGGLSGESYKSDINNCFATGTIFAVSHAGGLCGYDNDSVISSCYSASLVSAGYSVGGLCGSGSSTISNSYCYLYSGPVNGLGIALNDEQLVNKGSYVGFDFAGDTSDGTKNIWLIDTGYMPRLAGQASPGIAAPNRLAGIVTNLSGSGYPNDPFIIAGYDDLMEFRSNPALRIGNYRLTANIDLAGVEYSGAFIPEAFSGSFNADGKVISGITITGTDYLGFFALVLHGTVYGLGLENVNISGSSSIGGLCGDNRYGSISDCYVTGQVSGSNCIGGLCGENYGNIYRCYATAAIAGYDYVGGLCGVSWNGGISSSYAVGSVMGDDYVGGLVGNSHGTILSSYATGTVLGYEYTGGLCGNSYGSVSNCFASGAVYSAGVYKGGLLGYSNVNPSLCFWDKQTSGMNIGNGSGFAAGVTGLNTDAMQTLASFTAAGWDFTTDDGDAADWLMPVGFYPALAWENNLALAMVPSLAGQTLEQVQATLQALGMTVGSVSYYYDSMDVGQVFAQFPAAQSNWRVAFPVNINISLGKKYSGGSGNFRYPYQIATVEDLVAMANNTSDYDKYFILTADIDLAGRVFNNALIAGDTDTDQAFDGVGFSGNLNGNGHAISNLTIDSAGYYAGLIGYAGPCKVQNLTLTNVNISALKSVGGLCGYNGEGTISSCVVTGFVNGIDLVGGVVGYNESVIEKSYVKGTVSGVFCTGGVCGYNYGILDKCCSFGSVVSTLTDAIAYFPLQEIEAGGICGINGGVVENCYSRATITCDLANFTNPDDMNYDVAAGSICGGNGAEMLNSYATGSVNIIPNSDPKIEIYRGAIGATTYLGGLVISDITGCFWDTEASGIEQGSFEDPGLVGKNTDLMRTLATFTAVGWDVYTNDGDAADWLVRSGYEYPILAWQGTLPGDVAGSWAVDITDLKVFAYNWLDEMPAFDLDGKPGINMGDFAILAENWLADTDW